MPSTQEITRRIKSVKSTKKVTRAMQMVAASKMRKSQGLALEAREYEALIKQVAAQIPSTSKSNFPLLYGNPKSQNVLVLLITTNRGLVGSLNANIISALNTLERESPEHIFEYVTFGKKGAESIARLRKNLIADFHKDDQASVDETLYQLSKFISDKFASGNYKRVMIAYSQFKNSISQVAKVSEILPIHFLGDASSRKKPTLTNQIIEPDASTILSELLPRALEAQIRQTILENDASEHSARMIMMKNASDAAGELIADLTLTHNQLRQNKITTELSEITAGRLALSK